MPLAAVPAWAVAESSASVAASLARRPLPLVPTADGRFAVALERLYFELPSGWKAPVEAPGGALALDGDGLGAASLAFHPEGSERWSEPADVRRRLRSNGSIEDGGLLQTVTLSGRYGTRRRWTTHRYKGKWSRLGAAEEVVYTETILVPDPEGIYLLSFQAPKKEFDRRRAGFAELLRSVRLPKPRGDAWLPDLKSRRLAVPAGD